MTKQHDEVEKITEEFHEEVLIDMSLNNIISDTQEKWITNFIRKALTTQRKTITAELEKKHREEMKEVLDALESMYEQYCGDSGHIFMSAGERASSVLERYTEMKFDDCGAILSTTN